MMKRPVDIFEFAALNTLRKVRNITNAGNDVTTDPRVSSNDDAPSNEFVNSSDISETASNIQTSDGPNNDSAPDDEDINWSSDAAKALIQLEYLRKIDMNDAVVEQAQKITAVEEKLMNIMNEDLKLTREEINLRNRLKWKIAESSVNDEDLTITRKFAELRKRHKERKPKFENEKNSPSGIEEKKAREQIATIYQTYENYCAMCEQATEAIKHCENPSKLLAETTSDLLNIRNSRTDFSPILTKAKRGTVEANDIETCNQILQRVTLLLHTIKNKMNLINEEMNQKDEIEPTALQKIEEASVERCEVDPPSSESEVNENISERYICKESLVEYTKWNENLQSITNQADEFLKNPHQKILSRELRMAIGTSVNTLSVNANHMRDKFEKISLLLLGNLSPLKMNISKASRDEYYPFLLNNLSKRFISHIESLAPVKTADAFVPASVIVAIWIRFPDFGPVLLAHFAEKCPYIIPAYWPQHKGQSERDFYISRGYQYTQDGSIEDQNKFLLRMVAIFTLYIAITVIVPRGNQPHPHGLCQAWKWLASILNLDPRPDITAALLHVFLEIAGWKMSLCYGAQFWKMMQLMNTEYIKKIEKVTAADFRGPVSRLKGYIEKLLQSGRFSEPKGILPPNYW